ncbi:GpE family phage tail protein [Serratia plymuthica]|uniref:GpE family phage tail protein n=1 Tax=Serratia plymuthica TaxID=82996 RepID=UPI00398B5FDF
MHRRADAFFDQSGAVRTERSGDGEQVRQPLFTSVDDLIADIAVVFHWPPSEMYGMELRELMAWRQRAAIRSGNHDDEDEEDDHGS